MEARSRATGNQRPDNLWQNCQVHAECSVIDRAAVHQRIHEERLSIQREGAHCQGLPEHKRLQHFQAKTGDRVHDDPHAHTADG